MFRPIGIRKRGGGGKGAKSKSKASPELRMAHLFMQKYMNNSLILNIQIADTYMFSPQAIYFLTSLKEQEFFISSDIEVFFNCHYKYFYIKIKPFN